MHSFRVIQFIATLMIVSTASVSVLGATDILLNKRQDSGSPTTTPSGQPSPTIDFGKIKSRHADRCSPACQESEACIKAGRKQYSCLDQSTVELMVNNGTMTRGGRIKRKNRKGRGRRGSWKHQNVTMALERLKKHQDKCSPACNAEDFCIRAGPGQWACQNQATLTDLFNNQTLFRGGRKNRKNRNQDKCNPGCQPNQRCRRDGSGGWACKDRGERGSWKHQNATMALERLKKHQDKCSPACNAEDFCIRAGPGQWACQTQATVTDLFNNGTLFRGGRKHRKNRCEPGCQDNQKCTRLGPGQWACQDLAPAGSA